MNRSFFNTVGLVIATAMMLVVYQNCSGGGGAAGGVAGSAVAPAGLGTFVDDPVAGLTYTTSSGISGVTNALGQFQFNPGDTVTFYAMGVQIGSTTPTIAANGTATVTPLSLVPGATDVTNPQVTSIAQFLNTLNAISTANGAGATGTFVIPSDSNLQTQLKTAATSASTLTEAQLQAILDSVFGHATYTVTSAADAQTALQTGVNSAAIIGTVWSGTCTCNGGAMLYFQPNGVLTGLTSDGNVITGTWSVDSLGNVTFSGGTTDNGYGQGGTIAAGSTTGSLNIYDSTGAFQGVLSLTEVTSSTPVTNASWLGYWLVTATPSPGNQGQDDQGGCANLIASASGFTAVTNDGQAFSGAISASGVASGSFQDGNNGTTMLSFNMSSLSGSYSHDSGTGSGTLSLSRGGTCTVNKNNNNNGGSGPGTGGGPTPTPTPSPTSSPNPTPSPTPSPSPSNAGGGNIDLSLSISWANTSTSADSISVALTVYDGNGNNLGSQIQSESEGGPSDSGVRSTMTDNIGVNWNIGFGATYQVQAGQSPCAITNGSGTIQSNGTYPTVQITCN